MALILSCQTVSKSHGARLLFEGISMGISDGERVGLIGPNGAGKSTFLKLLLGQEAPDSGTLSFRKLARLSYVPQDPVFPSGKTVGEVLRDALVSLPLDEAQKEGRLAVILGRMKFADADAAVETLSGGWTKRLAIACGLVVEPDLLLLDEPTNHLDLEGILWLEDTLRSAPFATLLVSHDRYLLENSVSRMLELSRLYPEGLLTVEGSYSQFLEKKADFLSAQEQLQQTLANRARRELEWLRRGAKARTRKSQARIDAAGRLMASLEEVRARNVQQTAVVDFTSSNRKTKRLLTLDNVSKRVGEQTLFQDLSITLSPGAKLGLLGQNGSGKTTLLKLLNGELAPDTGRIERADGLRIVTFDQNRRQLIPEETLRRSLAPLGDSVIYRDRSLHVHSWARRFLFSNEQLDLPVSRLSGGEQARVMIARMMLEPADVLLLDEPTNDLDIPTLEVLEESLVGFSGRIGAGHARSLSARPRFHSSPGSRRQREGRTVCRLRSMAASSTKHSADCQTQRGACPERANHRTGAPKTFVLPRSAGMGPDGAADPRRRSRTGTQASGRRRSCHCLEPLRTHRCPRSSR